MERILAGHDVLMRLLIERHLPDLLGVGVTMQQTKALYLASVTGGCRMSQLAARLGVTLSTVSGLVDRLVDQQLVTRHDDPADRRQVVVAPTPAGFALLERFRELNQRQLREVLDRLTDVELDAVELAYAAMARAAAEAPPVAANAPAPDFSGTTEPNDTPDPAGTPDSPRAATR